MTSFLRSSLVAVALSLSFISSAYADISLPEPQTQGGMPLFESFKKRTSEAGGGFPAGNVSQQELSTVLWAASGLNRGSRGWTVPMALGKAPYVRIYVAGADGVYLYEWAGHYLREVSKEDIRPIVGQQAFTRRAAYSLIFVPDVDALANYNDPQLANDFSQMLTGAMSQDIYLAAASLKLSARYIHSIRFDEISSALSLPENSKPIGLILLGK